MLSGIPVIANIPANLLSEKIVFDDMQNIVLLNDLSPATVAEKIKILLSFEKTRKIIGQNGQNFISKNLNWEKVSHDMEVLLKKVMK